MELSYAFWKTKALLSSVELGGGIHVNDANVVDEEMMLTPRDLIEGVSKLSLGRKRHVLLKAH